jgi:two-component system, cell cycle response regulator DivK
VTTSPPLALIVEDQARLAEFYADALRIAGYVPAQVSDGRMAFDRACELLPRLILLDINLPYVAGTSIYAAMREDPRFTDTVIAVATANSIAAEELKPGLHEGDRLLTKPVNLQDLMKIAREVRATG